MARADFFTQTDKKQEYFSDFPVNFDKSPFTNDLGRLTNESSVRTAVSNLVQTKLNEALFQPNLGSQVHKSLFEPFSDSSGFTADDIKQAILNTLRFNEPRVTVIEVTVIISADENAYTINVFFYVVNNPNPISIELVLQRVR